MHYLLPTITKITPPSADVHDVLVSEYVTRPKNEIRQDILVLEHYQSAAVNNTPSDEHGLLRGLLNSLSNDSVPLEVLNVFMSLDETCFVNWTRVCHER